MLAGPANWALARGLEDSGKCPARSIAIREAWSDELRFQTRQTILDESFIFHVQVQHRYPSIV